MNYNNINVLLLEGYARQILPMAKAFSDLGCKVTTFNASKLDVGYASRYPNEKIIGCCSTDNPGGTVEAIRALLKTGKYDLVVPMVDFSAAILSKNKAEFSQYAKVAVNDWELYDIAQDKLKTMKVCMENDIPCPITLFDVNTLDDIKKSGMQYPIVVKPRVSYGAIGFKVMQSEEDMHQFFVKFHDTVGDYVFQEYIPQTGLQYEAAMFMDQFNNIKSSLVFSKTRWFPINGGSSTLNTTIRDEAIMETCSKLMRIIGWRGCADIDLIQDLRDGKAKIMEINPRVSGSVKICFESGINLAKQILEYEFDETVTQYDNYNVGQRLRCSQTDFLWFLKSPNRFKTTPSWFSMKNTKDHTFSFADPLPWFSFSIQGLGRYSKELKKRSK